MSVSTLKSAIDSRVFIPRAEREASAHTNSGNELMCPAGAGDISHDVYGRPSTYKTLKLTDAACSNFTGIDVSRYITYENNHRPYLPVQGAGERGYSDFMGRGRNMLPMNLYGEGYRGMFDRVFPTKNNAPPAEDTDCERIHQYHVPYIADDLSHDTTSGYYMYRG